MVTNQPSNRIMISVSGFGDWISWSVTIISLIYSIALPIFTPLAWRKQCIWWIPCSSCNSSSGFSGAMNMWFASELSLVRAFHICVIWLGHSQNLICSVCGAESLCGWGTVRNNVDSIYLFLVGQCKMPLIGKYFDSGWYIPKVI